MIDLRDLIAYNGFRVERLEIRDWRMKMNENVFIKIAFLVLNGNIFQARNEAMNLHGGSRNRAFEIINDGGNFAPVFIVAGNTSN